MTDRRLTTVRSVLVHSERHILPAKLRGLLSRATDVYAASIRSQGAHFDGRVAPPENGMNADVDRRRGLIDGIGQAVRRSVRVVARFTDGAPISIGAWY